MRASCPMNSKCHPSCIPTPLNAGPNWTTASGTSGRCGAVRTVRFASSARVSVYGRGISDSPMPVVRIPCAHAGECRHPRRLALVAEVNDGDGNNVVGLGNVGGIDDDHAELGLVVADAWQRRGIGLALATELLRAAEGRGYQRFVVHAFSDNAALRPFLSHLANVVSRTTRRGVSEITFVLRESVAARSGAGRRWPKTPADELLEKAYERILAAKGGTSPY